MIQKTSQDMVDIFIIGGGVNGCGIARDAAGRGLSVYLAEMNDLGGATSSASTKLFHGGLRYLEYFEIGLVRHALKERETLLKAMPHISWPMRFVLPYHHGMRFENSTPTSRVINMLMPWTKGRRPAWLIRFGLFLYDHLGSRVILPATKTVQLKTAPEGRPLKSTFEKAFEYSDCWIEDARLVILNARDAQARGATIRTRTQVVAAARIDDHWQLQLKDQRNGKIHTVAAKVLINATGPWVNHVLQQYIHLNSSATVRLVRGSHIVTKKLYDHDKCYFFQGADGRIIFAIPYETDFTLLGTTDTEHESLEEGPQCTPEEVRYLIDFANQYFAAPISTDDVVWTYSGVRPLYDDGAKSASATTRDFMITVDTTTDAPIMNIFGGKITTYRCLAEEALDKLAPYFHNLPPKWTAGVPLPGGDFAVDDVPKLIDKLLGKYPYLSRTWATRLIKAYGTEATQMLLTTKTAQDLGRDFGATLTETEVRWLMDKEYAEKAEDIIWRRSKLGLRLSGEQVEALDRWMQAAIDP